MDIIFYGATYKPNYTEDFRAAMCTEMKDVGVRNVDDVLPGWGNKHDELSGYWMVEQQMKEKAKANAEAKAEKAEKAAWRDSGA